ncbi:glycosyltransferase [Candidatus Woesearchaeota archaeon]|nr:glycosyltransferase [Candidatus Woesearchaeota archaeon]
MINKYVTKITTLSNVLVDVTKKIYPDKSVKKITEVYAAKTQLVSRSEARKALNKQFNLQLKDSDFIILSLGRIEKTKGLDELFSIIKKINCEKKISVKLLIGGTGKRFNHFKNKAKKFKNVHLLGFIPDKLMNSFYCSGNMFVFLGSKHLAGPLTLIEAMYAKNMCITSNNGSPIEVITDRKDGFLVDPENLEEVKNKIDLCHDLWLKGKDKPLCEFARKKIEDKFGFEKNYQSLIGGVLENP